MAAQCSGGEHRKEACSRTHFISVGDAEADVYDLFLLERQPGVDPLVRAAQDRRLAEPEQQCLRAALAASPVAATVNLAVPRQGERPARTAVLDVQGQRVVLRPPKARAAEDLPEVTVWAVWATETAAPPDAEPLGRGTQRRPQRRRGPPRRGAAGLAAADHRASAHHRGRADLPGVVRLPLGHRRLS